MALRLVEAFVPRDRASGVEESLEELGVIAVWRTEMEADLTLLRILVQVEQSDAVAEVLEPCLEDDGPCRAFILAVEAALPHPTVEEEAAQAPAAGRVSIEELQAEVQDMSRLTSVYVAMVVLSTIVAAIGLIRDSAAIVIGSMVIAPLIGPSVALALATTLADGALGRHALKTNAIGMTVALGIAFLMGLLVPVDPTVTQIASRTEPTLWDVLLGLAVGSAGVLSVTTGVSTALVGVMVAVALLPPLVVAGLLAGSGHWTQAGAAGVVLLSYVLTTNLAGVVAFRAQGVAPRKRWEAERARKAVRTSIALWISLIVALAALIYVTGLE
jgi:uncharacterized hydrophobic protein (TIGR00341 family)